MSIFGRSQPSEAETAMTLSGVPLPTLSDRAVLTNVTSLTSSSITLTWSVPQVKWEGRDNLNVCHREMC